MKPNIQMVGSFIQTLPRQRVPTNTRKKMPVGMEMSSVVTMKGPPRVGAQPEVNMWCAHTSAESPQSATIAPTAVR